MSDRRQDHITMPLEQLARALGGEVSGHQVLCPGPGHSAQDRSLAVRVNYPDGTWTVYSHAGDNPFVCKDHVRALAGLPAWNSRPKPNSSHQPEQSRPLEGGFGPRPSPDRKIVAKYDYVDEDGNFAVSSSSYRSKAVYPTQT
jgi:hypothetical protein